MSMTVVRRVDADSIAEAAVAMGRKPLELDAEARRRHLTEGQQASGTPTTTPYVEWRTLPQLNNTARKRMRRKLAEEVAVLPGQLVNAADQRLAVE